jgi:thiol-disulfide isomerase/thioredoxin
VVLDGELVTIGRARTCDFRIMEASVSSNHAQIKKTGSSYVFTDVGSTNGTIINGKTVMESDKVVLRNGDLLILGEVEIKVVQSGPMDRFRNPPSVGAGAGAVGGGGVGGGGGGRPEADQFLGKLVNSTNRKIVSGKTLRGKIVGIYFAARWCAACRGFTAILKRMYQELQDDGKPFEIIYVSSDQTTAQFNLYHGEMPWLAVPYADRISRDGLAKLYNKKNVPYLVLLDEEGNTITTQGRVILPRLGCGGYPFKLDGHEMANPPQGPAKVYPERKMNNNNNKHVGFSSRDEVRAQCVRSHSHAQHTRTHSRTCAFAGRRAANTAGFLQEQAFWDGFGR